jgi:RNA polymerase sigma-70 factor (ECF subfamily)
MREHSARVLAYAYNRGASRSEAEDVVAEVFLVCWRRLDDVPAPALPWLVGVARKVLANQRRALRRREALQTRIEENIASFDAGRGTLSAVNDSSAGVLGALAQLNAADQDALLLVAWDGLSNKESAQVLGCSQAAFGVRLYRARRRLLKHLEEMRTSSKVENDIGQREAP